MITKLGMSDILGPVVYSEQNNEVFLGKDLGTTKNYSEKVAEQIDEEVYKFVMQGYERALKILEDNKDIMIFISNYLIKHEVMDGEQFELCFTDGVTEEMLDEVTARKKKVAETDSETRKEELNKKKKKASKTNETEEIFPEKDASPDEKENNSDNQGDEGDIFSDDILNH